VPFKNKFYLILTIFLFTNNASALNKSTNICKNMTHDKSLSTLRQYIPYSKARKIILNDNWQQVVNKKELISREKRLYNLGWKEVESCSGTGLGFCAFNFKDKCNNKLRVITAGELPYINLEYWSITSKNSNYKPYKHKKSFSKIKKNMLYINAKNILINDRWQTYNNRWQNIPQDDNDIVNIFFYEKQWIEISSCNEEEPKICIFKFIDENDNILEVHVTNVYDKPKVLKTKQYKE
jgi:hypothetical protein